MKVLSPIFSVALVLGFSACIPSSLNAQVEFRIDAIRYYYETPSPYPMESVEMKHGRPNGKVVYYEHGDHISLESWVDNGILIGSLKRFGADGKLSVEANYGSYGPPTWERYLLLSPRHETNPTKWYQGNFFGVLDGLERKYDSKGQLHEEIEWIEGEMTGKFTIWRTWDTDTAVLSMRGQYLHNRHEGVWELFDDNGRCFIRQTYHQDKLHGPYWDFDSLGRLASLLHFREGARDSIATYYFPNGMPSIRRTWEEGGESCWEERYFENGALLSQVRRVDGQRQGEWRGYDSTGMLQTIGNFVDGKKDGEWKHLTGEGNPILVGQFKEGNLENMVLNGKQIVIQPTKPDLPTTEAESMVLRYFPNDDGPPLTAMPEQLIPELELGPILESLPGPATAIPKDFLPTSFTTKCPLRAELFLMGNGRIENVKILTPMKEAERIYWVAKLQLLNWEPALHGHTWPDTFIQFSIYHSASK